MNIGDRVFIVDGSEAHLDRGVIYDITNGIYVILLDAGCAWPVLEHEFVMDTPENRKVWYDRTRV